MAENLKHESFSVQDISSGSRKRIVRQDRVAVIPKKFFVKHVDGDFKGEILNISTFGLAIIINETQLAELERIFAKDSTAEFLIYTGTFEIQTVRLAKVRQELHPVSVFKDYVIGFESAGGTIATDCIHALEVADEMIAASAASAELSKQIPAPFKQVVFEMKEFLSQLRDKVDQVEKSMPQDSASTNSEFKETLASSLSDYFNQVVPSYYQELPSLIRSLDKQTFAICSEFLRQQLGSYFLGSPFAHRAYHKPRGYAGDYEMMNHVYRNELVGHSLFDQCMQRYWIEEPAAQAVKNRGQYLLQKIKDLVRTSDKKVLNVLSVASGPAMEQQLFLKECAEFKGKQVNFVCIDQDEESLKHAQRQMMSIERLMNTGHTFQFRNMAIKNILTRGLPSGNFDLIYSAGLFDYFSDPVAQLAAAKLYDGLSDEGALIIGNFSKDNPTQPLMEILLEWYLIHRSAEELTNLFSKVGTSVEIEKEPLGINLFAVIK